MYNNTIIYTFTEILLFILLLKGIVTDGEYCTLRSQGETRPLNLWQIIHDAKASVKKMKKETILDMLILQAGTMFCSYT